MYPTEAILAWSTAGLQPADIEAMDADAAFMAAFNGLIGAGETPLRIVAIHGEIVAAKNANPLFLQGAPMPATFGAACDLLHDVRTARLTAEKAAEPLKGRESEVREYLIQNISKSEDGGAIGKRYKGVIVEKRKPAVKDWEKFFDFVAAEKRFDLLQKRVSDKPVMELYEEGKLPPGIETALIPELSLTKI